MTPARRAPGRSFIALIALVALLAAACGPTTPTAAPSTAAPSAGAASGQPSPSAAASPDAGQSSVAPSAPSAAACDPACGGASATPEVLGPDDPNAALYAEIEEQVAGIRGLTATGAVERAVFDADGLCAYVTAAFAKDNPEDLVAGTETLLKALLLMPEDASLEDLYLQMLTSQVVGLYDDETRRMYVLSNSGEIGPAEQMFYSHEYTHALQDQAYGIRGLRGTDTDQGDRALARLTLLEGDATLAMYLWAQQHLSPVELLTAAGAGDPASAAVLDQMPAILRETLMFPYLTGLTTALTAYGSGGYAAIDALYADPPDSTEQILHADKLASREAPVTVALPDDLASRLGDGWSVALQDTLGEFQLGILLKEVARTEAPLDAAAGWGGDRVALVKGPAGEVGVALTTAWDTGDDAAEFAAAADDLVAALEAAGRSAAAFRPAPDRVVVVSAESDDTLGRLANVLGLAG